MESVYGAVIRSLVYPICDEVNAVQERVMLFIEEHGLSRFLDLDEDACERPFVKDCAGVKKYDAKRGVVLYYFFPFFFKKQFGISGEMFCEKLEFIRPFLPQIAIHSAIYTIPAPDVLSNYDWRGKICVSNRLVCVDYREYYNDYTIDSSKILDFEEGGWDWIENEYHKLIALILKNSQNCETK